MARPEEAIERRFVTECLKLGIHAIKFEIPGRRGAPDRMILLPNGRVIFIEFKRPGGKTSEHQIEFIKYLDDLGHRVIVSDSWIAALEWVKSSLQNNPHVI